VRIARAAAELGIETVSVYSSDDAGALHRYRSTRAHPLAGSGPSAYLDMEGLLDVAARERCDALHPGYGFLSESAAFARRCAASCIRFVGPDPDTLDILGDKGRARALARELDVPVLEGTDGRTTLAEARQFLERLGPGGEMMIKAIAGGGGRGMRAVLDPAEVAEAWQRARSEAQGAFGCPDVYVERLLRTVRHVEVQVVGDGTGEVAHLGERECTIQRRHQKLVEIAPSPFLDGSTRREILDCALRMARAIRYAGLGTFEFLVDASGTGGFHFVEANPRLQVEHTVTEEVTGIDLVKAQIGIAAGRTLAELDLVQSRIPEPRGHAIQLRVNLETIDERGVARPSSGTLDAFDPPSGPGIRVDTCGYAGLNPSRAFDSLIAKLIAHDPSPRFADAVDRAYRAACEFRILGASTNLPFLQNLLIHPDFRTGRFDTTFVDRESARLAGDGAAHRRLFADAAPTAATPIGSSRAELAAPLGADAVAAPMLGRIVGIDVAVGDAVAAGAQLLVLESMKMEHAVPAPFSGVVRGVAVAAGDVVDEGQPMLFVEPADVGAAVASGGERVDPERIRADLAELQARHAYQLDGQRPDAVAARHRAGKRTARENVADLVDPGTFIEYGPLAVAAQRSRRPIDELRRISPADGLVTGIGSVNGDRFRDVDSRCMVLAYDYTVFAGTQGFLAHRKKDRVLELAERFRLPVVVFAEGGGGRPGDTDNIGGANPSNPTFWRFSRLSALVPLVGITTGRCFAGNAVLLGACDVIIATRDATIGMGGPVMIEYGGLGKVSPEEVGPVSFQAPNGVIDIVVEDEAEAVSVAKRYLSYFQGTVADWACADQLPLRHAVPENRLRAYDVRKVIETLADTGSVLELRRAFGPGIVTALARIEGRPIGIVANNPMHLAGAIDADEADKAARFMQLCDAFDIPLLSLCDTPGFMVGPAAEKRALVRHTARMFVTSASLTVPMFVVVLRKGYGLGAMAIGGASFQRASLFAVSWPTGEFGAMGLEGAVRLAYRNELAAIDDPEQRERRYLELVERMYEHGKAVNIAPFLAFDDVIDPVDTRHWIVRGLRSLPAPEPRRGKKRPNVDPW
ncbi:MAG TPA: carboxyl transferase domain-containing protein, partial [Zeimonas sp.]|nr:carboxyl transferase domain-containing protein [Zeimonas sp.]